MKREEENKERERWQPGGGGKNKKCHLSGNAEVVPVSEPSKKVVPLFEREKRSCQYLTITLKVVPLYDVNPFLIWLIYVIIVYVVLRHDTSKTSYGSMIVF